MSVNTTINEFKTTRLCLKCPYCDRKKTVTVCDAVPRNRIDCRSCAATAMIRLIRDVVKNGKSHAKIWDVEWSHSSVDA